MIRQNPTDSTFELSQAQIRVLEALVVGATVTEAAQQANVDRSTIYAWRSQDPDFQAELARLQQERVDAMRLQLLGLADAALETVRETMEVGAPTVRLKAALAVLTALGAQSPEPGPTDRDEIANDLASKKFANFRLP